MFKCAAIVYVYDITCEYVFCTIDPPAITTEIPHTLRVMPGDEHKIDCAATGNPQPSVVWRKSDTVDNPMPYGNVGMWPFSSVFKFCRRYRDDMATYITSPT